GRVDFGPNTMLVNIADIKKGTGLWKNFSFQGQVHFDGLELTAPVSAEFKLTNAGSRILADGTVATTARLLCCRCAEPFEHPLTVEVQESFVPEDSREVPREDLQLEDLSIFTYREDRLEFDEILRQNLIAALPVKPLCRPDCRGLCDQCGQNLNQKACNCSGEEIDPRWGPLLKLKQNPGG
ncbi:MAG: DUF177 domain-containing protein, partial [Candidatus Eremiobacterota bacterium]